MLNEILIVTQVNQNECIYNSRILQIVIFLLGRLFDNKYEKLRLEVT